MKPVRFNATYDAGVSKIGCFFTIVDHFVAAIKKDGSDGHPLNILKVFTTTQVQLLSWYHCGPRRERRRAQILIRCLVA